MRPFFPYYGSKWNIARHYPAPAPGLVIEPFSGAAGYATFYDCPRVHLVDADPIIAGLWSYLIGVTAAEILALPEMPEVGDCVDNYALPQEAKWLIGFWLNRGSAQPKKSRTAYSSRTDKAQLIWGARAKERIASQLLCLAGWSVSHGSYDRIENVAATWFVDPPYGDKGRYYRIGFDQYAELGAWCRTRDGVVIACEGAGSDWLPFLPLGDFKSSLGRAQEVIYVSPNAAVPDLFSAAHLTPTRPRRRQAGESPAQEGDGMSNRSLIELNHDYCPRDDAAACELGRALQRYMRGADADELPDGVIRKHYRHHSDPDPMDGRETAQRVQIV